MKKITDSIGALIIVLFLIALGSWALGIMISVMLYSFIGDGFWDITILAAAVIQGSLTAYLALMTVLSFSKKLFKWSKDHWLDFKDDCLDWWFDAKRGWKVGKDK